MVNYIIISLWFRIVIYILILEGNDVCMKHGKHKNYVMLTAVSALLCLATVASVVAFILNRISLKKQHDIKWRDYEDCGIF